MLAPEERAPRTPTPGALRRTFLGAAVVLAVMTLGAVVLWAATEGLWLVVASRAAMTARRIPMPSFGFLHATWHLANIGRLPELCGSIPILNGQTPRLARCIFERASASLISAKQRQPYQLLAGVVHGPLLNAEPCTTPTVQTVI
jgi:hypothetical protein